MGFLLRLVLLCTILLGLVLSVWNLPSVQNRHAELIMTLSSFVEKVALPYRLAQLSLQEPDTELLVPIRDLSMKNIADTWGSPRTGARTHEGVDMFARRGTPVFSATRGYVVRTGVNALGGNIVLVLGAGGVRYYYAHLDSIAEGITYGKEVTPDTVLGFVGSTGNATGTPPHLHFGMYKNGAENPYSLLKSRI